MSGEGFIVLDTVAHSQVPYKAIPTGFGFYIQPRFYHNVIPPELGFVITDKLWLRFIQYQSRMGPPYGSTAGLNLNQAP